MENKEMLKEAIRKLDRADLNDFTLKVITELLDHGFNINTVEYKYHVYKSDTDYILIFPNDDAKEEIIDKYYKEKNELQCKSDELKEECKKLHNQLMQAENDFERAMSKKNAELDKWKYSTNKYFKQINELRCELKEPANNYDEQSHLIYENQLLTTIDILTYRYAQLRKNKGLS